MHRRGEPGRLEVGRLKEITATELQLLACFGAEPQLREPTDPWCYNDAA